MGDYEGFGRVYDVGVGGVSGWNNPSRLSLISGDSSETEQLRLVEYPKLGVLFEFARPPMITVLNTSDRIDCLMIKAHRTDPH